MDDTFAGLAAAVLAVRQGTAVRDRSCDLLADPPPTLWPAVVDDTASRRSSNRRAFSSRLRPTGQRGPTAVPPHGRVAAGRRRGAVVRPLGDMLHRDGGRHLSHGFVITRNGVCLGLGTAPSVFRRLAERREAVRFQMAHHDSLTGLPNRQLFADRLQQAVARARRSGHPVAGCTSTSIGSRTSTRASVTPLGTGSSARSPAACVASSGSRHRRAPERRQFGMALVEMPDPGSGEVVARRSSTSARRPIPWTARN